MLRHLDLSKVRRTLPDWGNEWEYGTKILSGKEVSEHMKLTAMNVTADERKTDLLKLIPCRRQKREGMDCVVVE